MANIYGKKVYTTTNTYTNITTDNTNFHGTIKPSKTNAIVGETIILTSTMQKNYFVDCYKVNEIKITGNKFVAKVGENKVSGVDYFYIAPSADTVGLTLIYYKDNVEYERVSKVVKINSTVDISAYQKTYDNYVLTSTSLNDNFIIKEDTTIKYFYASEKVQIYISTFINNTIYDEFTILKTKGEEFDTNLYSPNPQTSSLSQIEVIPSGKFIINGGEKFSYYFVDKYSAITIKVNLDNKLISSYSEQIEVGKVFNPNSYKQTAITIDPSIVKLVANDPSSQFIANGNEIVSYYYETYAKKIQFNRIYNQSTPVPTIQTFNYGTILNPNDYWGEIPTGMINTVVSPNTPFTISKTSYSAINYNFENILKPKATNFTINEIDLGSGMIESEIVFTLTNQNNTPVDYKIKYVYNGVLSTQNGSLEALAAKKIVYTKLVNGGERVSVRVVFTFKNGATSQDDIYQQ